MVCVFVFLISAGIILFPGCQKHDNVHEESLDPTLLNSSELEEYIIAGTAYRQAQIIFQSEISKIDFLNLKFEKDTDGSEVAHLPVSVNIEEKAQIFKQKKDALLAGFPQFTFLTAERKREYLQTCIKNSVPVNMALLDLGININLPMTKKPSDETTIVTGPVRDVLEFLEMWVDNNFNEITIVVFADGSAIYYKTSEDGPTSSFTPTMQKTDGKCYYEGKQVSQIIHTQPDMQEPSADDLAAKESGVIYSTYYNGKLKNY